MRTNLAPKSAQISTNRERNPISLEIGMANVILIKIFVLLFVIHSSDGSGNSNNRQVIELNGTPDDVVWVVQLSDLHFSVHHPDRAREFRNFVGPALSLIKPSLILLTGDLTDGKSKDLLTMKQDEEEWIEYQKAMKDVIKRSGLDKSTFYDVRGNHDNFGVPVLGGPFDFFSKYSINGQLQRNGTINSVTIQTKKRKLLFVGFDSTMSPGLRGPTNLFGHPTDELLADINSELSQWDSHSAHPVTKVSFGHFTLSFSAASKSGKTLQDIFTNHSLAAYLCGHLHTKFGINLKRHHHSNPNELIQLNGHRRPHKGASNCLSEKGFWEWEMGDWRKSRMMRILAIDRGRTSFIDINFKKGAIKTIILPTFPLDSRVTSTSSHSYKCEDDPFSHGAIRALVFSTSPIVSVLAKVYDSRPGNLINVLETPMTKVNGSRGDVYVAHWNILAFEDPSPERYLLQIEATDIMGRLTSTELRPFSVTGIPATFSWSWKEFIVMGCQWDSLYLPILWVFYGLVLLSLVVPKMVFFFSKRRYTYKNFKANKTLINGLLWVFMELYNIPVVWLSMIGYFFYLVVCPWLYGQVFTSSGEKRAYMTYKGWVLRINSLGKIDFLGFPDVMVVVLPHLFFVVLPALLMIMVLAAERGVYRDYLLSLSSKKNDDTDGESMECASRCNCVKRYWIRKLLLVVPFAVVWKHFKNCVALMKAYEMNPIIHFPIYSLGIPLLLAYTILKTSTVTR